MTMRLTSAVPQLPLYAQCALALPCATPATDLRTLDVRSDVRFGTAQGFAQPTWAKRIRVTAATTGMGHVGTAFGAGTVPGSPTWSPPT